MHPQYPQQPQQPQRPQQPQQPQQGPYPPPAFGYSAQPGYPATPWPPPQPPKPQWGKVAAAAVLGVAAIGGGALLAHLRLHGKQSGGSNSAACAVDDARTTPADSKGGGEPTILVPIRSGWEKFSADDIPGNSKAASDPGIRGIFINRDISENGFAPNIVVTLEKYTDQTLSPEQITSNESAKLGKQAQIGSRSTATTCGTDVTIADYTGINKEDGHNGQNGTSLFTVVRGEDGNMWVAGATILTTNTDNQEYRDERDALVKGFHVQFPKS
jgi:hypothetical protein